MHARPTDVIDRAGIDEEHGLARLMSGETAAEDAGETPVLTKPCGRLDVIVPNKHRLIAYARFDSACGRVCAKPVRQPRDRFGWHDGGSRIAHHPRVGFEGRFFDF